MKKVELPLAEPIYNTYQFQIPSSVTLKNNPSIRNWYLNEVVDLNCNRKFLSGFTTPMVDVEKSSLYDNPHLEKIWYSMRYAKGYINPIIRTLLDNEFFVYFNNVDDYYIKGKSWYKERHINHDGLICGYNREDKTYCIYAYDSNWICRKFWISQKDFESARKSMFRRGLYGEIYGIKPKSQFIEFNPKIAIENIEKYLDSSMEKHPKHGEGKVYGTAVYNYIAMYIDMLYSGKIPYERMDRRIFRLIWEHKKAMLERLDKIEEVLNMNSYASTEYSKIVAEADRIRMLYASYHMKRRDSLLPIIRNKLIVLKENEIKILNDFIKESKGVIKNETLELFEN